jgi:signal transduction histidine kinase
MTFGTGHSEATLVQFPYMYVARLRRRTLRIIGLSTWVVASLPTLLICWHTPGCTTPARFTLWVAAFLLYGAVFWLASAAVDDLAAASKRSGAHNIALIAVQSAATLLMVYLVPCFSISILLVPVAWQAALLLPLPTSIIWIVFQSALLAVIFYTGLTSGMSLFATNTSLGFQLFGLLTALVAKSEARARAELSQANAELRATRELLAETSRISERARISDELHDVLGHNLAALSINLEVAKHLTVGKALEHVEKSQSLAKILLKDVRDVVSAYTGDNHIDVKRAVEALVDGLPCPRIHLTLPDDLKVEDSTRANTLLRCVQEVVTNTLKHSEARNLWLEIHKTDDGIEVRARDDGRGAQTVQVGRGLTGMRKRLEQIGGKLTIDSRPEEGFAVQARLPFGGAAS